MKVKNENKRNRYIEKELKIALQFSKIILINGMIGCGKTTLIKQFKEGRAYVDLSKKDKQLFAINHPELFFKELKFPVILENIEEAPQLYGIIFVNKDRIKSGDIILTSNIRPTVALTNFIKTMDNTISVFKLNYLTAKESEQFDLNFNNLKLPVNLETKDNILSLAQRAFDFGSQIKGKEIITKVINNALKHNYKGSELEILPDLLIELAKAQDKVINVARLAILFDKPKQLINSLIILLEKTQVIFFLKPIQDERLKYTTKTERLYFYNQSLVCSLLKIKSSDLLTISPYSDSIINAYLINQIMINFNNRQITNIYNYYENINGQAVNLIINNVGSLNLIQFQIKMINEKKLGQIEKIFQKANIKLESSLVVSYDVDSITDTGVFSAVTPDIIG